MDSIQQYVSVAVSTMDSDSFNFTVMTSQDNNLRADITINYGKNVSKGTILYISLEQPENLTTSSVYIQSFEANQTLQELYLCPDSYYYDKSNNYNENL